MPTVVTVICPRCDKRVATFKIDQGVARGTLIPRKSTLDERWFTAGGATTVAEVRVEDLRGVPFQCSCPAHGTTEFPGDLLVDKLRTTKRGMSAKEVRVKLPVTPTDEA